jgi:hypothetical protein
MFEEYTKGNDIESLVPAYIFVALLLLFLPCIGLFILADIWDDLNPSQSDFREYEIEYDRIAVVSVGGRSFSHYMVLSNARREYSIPEAIFKDEISMGELESLLRMSSKAKVWVQKGSNRVYGIETTEYVIPLEKGMKYLSSNARVGLYFSLGFFFVGAIPIVFLIIGALSTFLEIMAAKLKRMTGKL